MSEPDIETLRGEVAKAVTDVRRRQTMTWEFMENDVDAASDKFMIKRDALIEERIRILAEGTHPTLLESVIGLVVVAFPFAAATRGLLAHWSRSMKIGKVTGVLGGRAKNAAEAAEEVKLWKHVDDVLMRQTSKAGDTTGAWMKRPYRTQYISETVEYNASLQKFAEVYGLEIATSTRALVKSAAERLAKPVVSQDRIFDPKAAQEGGAPADASDYLKGVRDWIVRSKNAEIATLEDMEKQAEKTQDIKQLKAIGAFIKSDVFADKSLKASYDREVFQRSIEMCLWCTTWDFTPKWHPGNRATLYGFKAMALPHFEAPPLGESFWKFACDRYYDPFFGDGTQTYSQIGRNRQIGDSPAPPLPPQAAAYWGDKADQVFGQHPSERLAYNWGNIVAPRLLDLNKELGQALERQLRMNKKRMSEPSEADVFNQYLMGLRKLE